MAVSVSLEKNHSLKRESFMSVGGTTRHFFRVRTAEQMADALECSLKITGGDTKKILIIGDATNILFPDGEFAGCVIKNEISFLKADGSNIWAGAGTSMKSLLKFCLVNHLSGLAWSSGLPGTVGGAVRGNAGAFGGEIKDPIIDVTSIDISKQGKLSLVVRKKKECDFGYRSSVFKKNNINGTRSVIINAHLKLKPKKSVEEDKKQARKIFKHRWSKHPMDFPSLGSTFKNIPIASLPAKVGKFFSGRIKYDPIPVLPVAILLDTVGLKGLKIGGAKFSEKHPNFIINTGRARSSDVKRLISEAKRRIWRLFRVKLEEEIEILR